MQTPSLRFWDPRLDKLNVKVVAAENPTYHLVSKHIFRTTATLKIRMTGKPPNPRTASKSWSASRIGAGPRP